MYDGEWGIALDPIQGNQASFQVDLGYTKLFHILAVTSWSFQNCEGVLVDSLESHQANQGSLHISLGTQNCYASNAGESILISRRVGSLMAFLKLRWEPGEYSRVTVGMAIQNSFLFSDIWTPVLTMDN